MTEMLKMIAPISYWILIILWSFILYFYVKKMWDSKTRQLFHALVVILAIDAFRTLFESVYFGLWYTSLSGLIPSQIADLLTRPELVIIPKIINVAAAVIIIVLLLKKWLPREEQEKRRLGTALYDSEQEFRAFFENNPLSCWLEDFSEVHLRFEALREKGISDIETYFDGCHEELEKLAQAIKIRDVNQATLDLHKVETKEQLFQGLEKTFTPESFECFRKEMVDLWNGKNQNSHEGVVKTFDGELRYVQISYRVLPGYENTLEKVLITLVDNTPRFLAEQKLLKSENMFKKYFQTNPSATFVWEARGNDFILINVNKSANTLAENRATNFLGLKANEIYEDMPVMTENLLTCFAQKSTIEFEQFYKNRSDGDYDWIRFRMAYTEPNLILLYADTISDQKRAEAALVESKKQYQDLYNNAPDMFASVDSKSALILRCNQTLADTLGYPKEEIINRQIFELYHPDCIDDAKATFDQFIASGQILDKELQLQKKDGDKIEVSLNVSKVCDDEGNIVYSRSSWRDITERKASENELIKQRDLFELVINSVPARVYWKDLNLSYLGCNVHFAKDSGMKSPKDVTGKDDYALVWTKKADEYRADDEIVISTGKPKLNYEESFINSEGKKVWWMTNKMPLRSRDGTIIGLVATSEDITEQKEYEDEKRKLEIQLQQSQKMESIGNLAGGIAHDFNNILASVLGYTELALDEVENESPIKEDLQEVYTAGIRAKDLVQQILTFARQSDDELKLIRVDLIIKEVLKFIRSSVPTTIEIKQNIMSDSLIMASSTQVHRIIMNLCTNAAYAMENEGGILEVTLKDISIDIATMRQYPHLKNGNYIEIKVSDIGGGIEPQIIEKIFEPYFTTKEIGKGTGMGLAVVHGIVETYGGKIFVESTLGKGTIFTIYLPVSRESKTQQQYKAKELPAGQERILFVDDEAIITKMTSRMLSQFGYSVTSKINSLEALELFRSKPNDFDLVISDVTMPKMTGDQLAQKVLEIRPDIPVILCTGYSKRLSEDKATEIGIKAFIYKPIVKEDLAKTVRRVLDEAKSVTYT